MLRLRAIALILLTLFFCQCQKELSYTGGPDPIPVLPEPIAARLQGTVLDENGLPAASVTVQLGVLSAITDARGYFRFQNANLDKKSSVVTAEKAGYFKAFRTFAATAGTNQVIIKLIPKVLVGTIDATTGGSVSLSNGGMVVLPANGIVKASNSSAYSGTVNVYAAYINPTSSDINQTVPGSFMANDKNGTRVTLASYGMMAVQLESPSDERLQIKSGLVATLTTPIPASLTSTAPSTIAMWSVNEQTGFWDEEGTATKQGNVYVGDVKHFSFWNCDVPANAIYLSMTINNNSNQPMVYAHVRLTRQTTGWFSQTHGYTDSLGHVSGLVPANETLLMEVLNMCGEVIYSQNIGPFSTDTDLGVITMSASAINVLTVTGTLHDCSGNPVANGYAMIYYDYYTSYASTDANGNFTTNFTTCTSAPATIDILGVDIASLQQSTVSSVPVTTPVTNAGTITVCGASAAQFLNYNLNGTDYTIGANPTDSLGGFTSGGGTTTSFVTYIVGSQGGNNINFSFVHTVAVPPVPGTYPMELLVIQNTQVVPSNTSSVTITSFPPAIGGFYEGTFTASYNGGTDNVSGSFRVRR